MPNFSMIDISEYIRDIADFPKPGVVFKDITPLLSSQEASRVCLEQLVSLVNNQEIDKVVGIESRGFLFGMMLAQELNAGFVPLRKPGKLPYDTYKEPYSLEYGMDVLEMHEDAIKRGDRVLIHDDVLATGGTAKAACSLVERAGGIVVQCNFIMQIDFLRGEDKLYKYDLASVLSY
jgi:adenine phosphoribosyltransferase